MENTIGSLVLIVVLFVSCGEPVEPNVEISSIEILPANSIEVKVDSVVQFTAYIITVQGDTLSDLEINWTSDDTSSVEINSTGLAQCKSVGEAGITANYASVTSTVVQVTVIPKQIQMESFFTGQRTSAFIEYTNINPDHELIYGDGHSRQYSINLDNDSNISIDFGIGDVGGNNLNVWFAIEGSNNLSVAWDSVYSLVADSMIALDFDSTQSGGYPFYYDEFFNRWSTACSEGTDILNQTEWIDPPALMAYWYKSDQYAYYSPLYGPLIDSGESYLIGRYENEYGYPVYVWIRVEFMDTPMRLVIKDYAIAPLY